MVQKQVRDVIEAQGVEIAVISRENQADYMSLTDIARFKSDEPNDVIKNWLRNRNTLEYLGLWERLNNPGFKPVEFDGFKNEAGKNSFVLSPQKWISATGAIGLQVKAGRYGGGTFAHIDIAMEFASWLSPEFKLYIIKDYQRLKKDESHRLKLEWNAKRELSKINYRIHTDAIKDNLIPPELTQKQRNIVYAREADVLNTALFGKTAKEWREQNPRLPGNIRDYASIYQLIVLVNIESINAELIKIGKSQEERLVYLRKVVVGQLKSITSIPAVQRLENIAMQSAQIEANNSMYGQKSAIDMTSDTQ